jgi:hypothetical protein
VYRAELCDTKADGTKKQSKTPGFPQKGQMQPKVAEFLSFESRNVLCHGYGFVIIQSQNKNEGRNGYDY